MDRGAWVSPRSREEKVGDLSISIRLSMYRQLLFAQFITSTRQITEIPINIPFVCMYPSKAPASCPAQLSTLYLASTSLFNHIYIAHVGVYPSTHPSLDLFMLSSVHVVRSNTIRPDCPPSSLNRAPHPCCMPYLGKSIYISKPLSEYTLIDV